MVSHAKHERNFHIFYQLIFGADDSMLCDELKLDRNVNEYTYLKSSTTTISQSSSGPSSVTEKLISVNGVADFSNFMDDVENFRVVENALEICEFDEKIRRVSLYEMRIF